MPCLRCGVITYAGDDRKDWKKRYEIIQFVCEQCISHGYIKGRNLDIESYVCRDCGATGGATFFNAISVMNYKSDREARPAPLCRNRKARKERAKSQT